MGRPKRSLFSFSDADIGKAKGRQSVKLRTKLGLNAKARPIHLKLFYIPDQAGSGARDARR